MPPHPRRTLALNDLDARVRHHLGVSIQYPRVVASQVNALFDTDTISIAEFEVIAVADAHHVGVARGGRRWFFARVIIHNNKGSEDIGARKKKGAQGAH